MHFALPPKNTPHPPPYARTGRSLATRRRQQLELGGYLILGILTIYLFLHYIFASKSSPEVSVPLGTPTAVIVTVLDDGLMSSEYIQKIKANREDYASRHGTNPRASPTCPLSNQIVLIFPLVIQDMQTSSQTQPPMSLRLRRLQSHGASSQPCATP